mmetsp:Transcript_64207/g.147127  ORF Transcript_64207/g.147127 Transcript_64207/m.147127 type:complete len:292 (-) Transcript_64207:5-880(-)
MCVNVPVIPVMTRLSFPSCSVLTGRHSPKSPNLIVVRSALQSRLEALMSRWTRGVSRSWRKLRAAQSCAHQEKDVALGGRHGVPFLLWAASTSRRHPPSMYSIKMKASAELRSSMFAPTKPTMPGCVPIFDIAFTSHTRVWRARFRFWAGKVRSSRIALAATIVPFATCVPLKTEPTDPWPICLPTSSSPGFTIHPPRLPIRTSSATAAARLNSSLVSTGSAPSASDSQGSCHHGDGGFEDPSRSRSGTGARCACSRCAPPRRASLRSIIMRGVTRSVQPWDLTRASPAKG